MKPEADIFFIRANGIFCTCNGNEAKTNKQKKNPTTDVSNCINVDVPSNSRQQPEGKNRLDNEMKRKLLLIECVERLQVLQGTSKNAATPATAPVLFLIYLGLCVVWIARSARAITSIPFLCRCAIKDADKAFPPLAAVANAA
jgi:hypothetical protein